MAKDDESLRELRKAEEEKDDRAYGLLLGYPASAVAAYNSPEAIDLQDVLAPEDYEKIRGEHLEPFMEFKFSYRLEGRTRFLAHAAATH